MCRPKVSVIIPVYGAERYIEHCAESLFSQTLDFIEYIFVDDCSPDDSIKVLNAVLNRYPERQGQVRIIRNKINLKQAGSRSVGLRAAAGDYIIHCDPDDWVENNIYELLYRKAISTDADIVTCDFLLEREQDSNRYHFPIIFSPHDCIQKATMKSHWSLWNRLVKRELIEMNKIEFIPGVNMWEDLGFMIQCYYFANKIEYVSKPLYHYNLTNDQSITNIVDNGKLEQEKKCIDFLESFFANKKEDFNGFIQMYRHFLKEQDIYNSNLPVFANLQRGGFLSRSLYKIVNVPRIIKTAYLIHSINSMFNNGSSKANDNNTII